MRENAKMKLFGIVTLFFICSAHVMACGVSWGISNMPAFCGINSMGEIDHTEIITYVNISEKDNLDLSINFNSNRQIASKMFGYGWWFGVTDSYVVKDTQDSYKFVMPDSQEIILKRNNKNKKIFENKRRHWVLEEISNGFLISGSCGVMFTYKRNLLDTVKYSNGTTLFFKYECGRLKQINAKGDPILSFRYDKDDIIYMDIIKEKRTIRFKLSEVPGYGKILSEHTDISDAKNAKKYTYEFSDDNINKISITQGNESKKYFWERDTGYILKDESYQGRMLVDTYEYTIENRENPDEYKYLKRKSNITKKEDIFYKNDRGISVSQRDSGNIVKIYEIMNINTSGKPRKIETKHPDGKIDKQLFLYDDQGRIIREIKNGKVLYNVKRNDRERSIIYYDGNWKPIWKKIFDPQNRVVFYEKSDGSKTSFKYLEDGEIEATLTKDGKTVTKIFNENLSIINER